MVLVLAATAQDPRPVQFSVATPHYDLFDNSQILPVHYSLTTSIDPPGMLIDLSGKLV